MSRGTVPGRWNVFFRTPADVPVNIKTGVDRDILNSKLAERRGRIGAQAVPFFIGPDGRPEELINKFFASALRRGRTPGAGHRARRVSVGTARAYAYDIRSYLNVLDAFGLDWRDVEEDDLDDVREWRVTADANPRRVSDGTWEGQVAALRVLYQYASRFGVPNPVPPSGDAFRDLGGAYVRASNVKWFDPEAYGVWRDVGLGGLLPDGTENVSFRGRNVQRDMAFANALYRTGLRVQECSSAFYGLEWPDSRDPQRAFRMTWLAAACAKGGRRRRYWIPNIVLGETAAYVLGERARAVTAGQARYHSDPDRLIVTAATGDGVLTLVQTTGEVIQRNVDQLDPWERRHVFLDRDGTLEPAMLWLDEDGTPRDLRSWNRTFARANDRVAALGVDVARLRPHYLRHSFALRWFVVGRLIWDRRFSGLTEDQAADMQEQLGSHWNLVQTLLGHRTPATTRNIYLEPFTALDIEMLLDHAADESVTGLMSDSFAAHPRVQTWQST